MTWATPGWSVNTKVDGQYTSTSPVWSQNSSFTQSARSDRKTRLLANHHRCKDRCLRRQPLRLLHRRHVLADLSIATSVAARGAADRQATGMVGYEEIAADIRFVEGRFCIRRVDSRSVLGLLPPVTIVHSLGIDGGRKRATLQA